MSETLNNDIIATSIINTGNLTVHGDTSLGQLDAGKITTNLIDVTDTLTCNNCNISGISNLSQLSASSGQFARSITAAGITSTNGLTINGTATLGNTNVNNLINVGSESIDGSLSVNGFSTFNGAVVLPSYTSIQMKALNASNGMIIFNTTTDSLYLYQNNSWISISGSIDALNASISGQIDANKITSSNLVVDSVLTSSNIESTNINTIGLSVNGLANVSNLNVGNMLTVDATGNVQTTGTLNVSNDANVQSLTVNSNEVVRGNLTVEGNIIASGQAYESQDFISTSLSIINDDLQTIPVTIKSTGTQRPIMQITHTDTNKSILIDNDCAVTIDGQVILNDNLNVNGSTTMNNLNTLNIKASVLNSDNITADAISTDTLNGQNLTAATLTATNSLSFPIYSTDDMNKIINPTNGMIIYNSTTNSLYASINNIWTPITDTISASSGSFDALTVANDSNFSNINVNNINAVGDITVMGKINSNSYSNLGNTIVANLSAANAQIENATLNGNLKVGGTTTLGNVNSGNNVITSLINTGNEIITGSLNVSGSSTLGTVNAGNTYTSSLTNSGNEIIEKNLEVKGTTQMDNVKCNKLNVTSIKTINDQETGGNLYVTGVSTVNRLNAGTTTVGGSLNVTGVTTLGPVNSNIITTTGLTNNGNETIGGDLNVNGNSIFKKSLTLPNYSMLQMNSINNPQNGMMVYNTTANKIYGYQNGEWDVISGDDSNSPIWTSNIKTYSSSNLFASPAQSINIRETNTNKLIAQCVTNNYALFTSPNINKIFIYVNINGTWQFSDALNTDYENNYVKNDGNSVIILSQNSNNSSIKQYTYTNGKLAYLNTITTSKLGYSQLTSNLANSYSTFTLSFWINTNGTTNANIEKNIISFGADRIYQKVDILGSPNITTSIGDINVTFELGIGNNWHHYLIQYTESSYMIYLDGILKAKGNGENIAIGENMIIGGNLDYSIAGIWFDNSIDCTIDQFYNNGSVPLGLNGELPLNRQPLVYLNNPASLFYQNRGTNGNFTQIGTFADQTGPNEMFGILNQIMAGILCGMDYVVGFVSYLSMINFNIYVTLHWFNNRANVWSIISRNLMPLTNNIKHAKTYIISDPLQICILDASPAIGGLNFVKFMGIVNTPPILQEHITQTIELSETSINGFDNYSESAILYDSTRRYFHLLCPNASCGGNAKGGMISYRYANNIWNFVNGSFLGQVDKDRECISACIFNNKLLTLSNSNKIHQWELTKSNIDPYLTISLDSEILPGTETFDARGKLAMSIDGNIFVYYLHKSDDPEYVHFYTRSNASTNNISYSNTFTNLEIAGNLHIDGKYIKLPISDAGSVQALMPALTDGTMFIDSNENMIKVLLNNTWKYLPFGLTKGDGVDHGYKQNSGDLAISGKLLNINSISSTNGAMIKQPNMPFDEITICYNGMTDNETEIIMQTNYLANSYSVVVNKNSIGNYTFSFTPSGFGTRKLDFAYLMSISTIMGFNRVFNEQLVNKGLLTNVKLYNLQDILIDTNAYFTFRIKNTNPNNNI